MTPKVVEKHIAKMKAEGTFKRVGPDKGGRWLIVEKRIDFSISRLFPLPAVLTSMDGEDMGA